MKYSNISLCEKQKWDEGLFRENTLNSDCLIYQQEPFEPDQTPISSLVRFQSIIFVFKTNP